MPKKFLTALLVVLFCLPITVQVSKVAAQEAPITSPITPPVTFFNLTGKVTYKRVGIFFQSANRIIPAQNVLVRVRGFFDRGKKFETRTDVNGNYAIELPAGKYLIEPRDSSRTFFTPFMKYVEIKGDNAKTANFQGIRFR